VFFDFDGVLCTDRFFAGLKPDYPQVREWVSQHIFSGEKWGDQWMRGEIDYRRINRMISDATGISSELLDRMLPEGVRLMQVNATLIRWAETLKAKGVKVALVTNNMDIFTAITVPLKQLDKTFPVIVNSCDYGLMKQDENGKLFDTALEKLGLTTFKNVLLIDDSAGYCDIFRAKGGEAYQYSNLPDFEHWAEENV
jgi:FMN phosphatase YigB (HAD superfamily)